MSGETFAHLLAPHLAAIRRFVNARSRMPESTDDIVQQTLLRAFVHRHQLRSHAKFLSWVSSIALNEIRGVARRMRPDIPVDAVPGLISSDQSAYPHRVYEHLERREWLSSGLAQLNGRDRATIELMDFQELNLKEAAKILSISLAAMKSAHFRARRRLHRALRGESQPGKRAELPNRKGLPEYHRRTGPA